jgi:hypothetical protein
MESIYLRSKLEVRMWRLKRPANTEGGQIMGVPWGVLLRTSS